MGAKLPWNLGVIAILAVSLAASCQAQSAPKYDLSSETKIKGVVEEVREVPGQTGGVLLMVKTDTKSVQVQVAPAAYLKEIDTSFNKGDEVSIVGAKVPNATEETILAREITVGNNTATLRDDKGIPVWSGWKPAKSTGK